MTSRLTGQSRDDIIKKIRDRYYRINGQNISLDKFSYQGTDYYLENNKLSIVKKELDTGRIEYYYDINQNKYYPYFIYFESFDEEKPDIRAYYDFRSLIMLKEDQKEKEISPFDNKYSYLELGAFNSINSFFNITELAKYPNDSRIDTILEIVGKLNASIFKTDTIKYNSDDNGEDGIFVFLDKQNIKLLINEFSVAEHDGEYNKEYYYKNQLIYTTSEFESWVGHMSWVTVTICYFERGEVFRKDQYNSHGTIMIGGNDTKHFLYFNNLDNVVPRIQYVDKKL